MVFENLHPRERGMRWFLFSVSQMTTVETLFRGVEDTQTGSQIYRKSGPYLIMIFYDYNLQPNL